jgi:hypothetical protein
MSNKYALIIGSSHSYAMGLNATLNALDYYGVKDIDVYVFSNKFMKEYFDYAKDKFDFPLYYIDTEELVAPYETKFTNDGDMAWKDCMFFWGKYPLIYQIKDKYEAIGHLDGDMMVVDDISESFRIAAETGKLLIASNGRTSLKLSQITEPRFNTDRNTLLEFCKGFPVLNYVFFFDANKYIDLIDYTWACRNETERNTKHYGLETAYFVEGLYKLNLLDKVEQLPFNYWISDDYLGKEETPLVQDNFSKYHLIAPDGNKIKVMHGRFWSEGITKTTITNTGANQMKNLIRNFGNYTILTDFLNFDWKVKLDVVVNMNPYYGTFLNPYKVWPVITEWIKTEGKGYDRFIAS